MLFTILHKRFPIINEIPRYLNASYWYISGSRSTINNFLVLAGRLEERIHKLDRSIITRLILLRKKD